MIAPNKTSLLLLLLLLLFAARTIKVEDVPSSIVTDDLEDYFSSKADSGGGNIDGLSGKRGCYSIVFEEEKGTVNTRM